ncbi:MAG: sulfurtransferase TusA family protein [Betaproteobacteria bacterium]|nr:sulfurtransferase TusA family protein [Betaproteobacteria bacterium]
MADSIDKRLDVCGVCCPLPIIRLGESIAALKPGQTLEIMGNDPVFEASVRDFCQANGHTILEVRRIDRRRIAMLIRVSA